MRKGRLIVILEVSAIIILGLAAYANSLQGGFVWDDYGLVVQDSYIKSWSNIGKVFTESFGSGGGAVSNFYRPLQALIHMIDYSLFGLNPWGYRLTSITAHILAALAAYWFISILSGSSIIAFIAGLLFLLHPIQTESVCFISGVSDPLSLLFILLSLRFYISNNAKTYFLSPAFFILALLSKENAVMLPLLVLALHYAFSRRMEKKKALPIFFIVSVYILFRVRVSEDFISSVIIQGSTLERIPGFFIATAEYSRLLIFPYGLHLDYGNRLFSFSDPRAISGAVILSALVLIVLLAGKKKPLVSFSLLWFMIMLIPVSNIYPVNESFMMEHWLYAPSLGLFLLFASLLCRPCGRKYTTFSLRVFLALIIAAYIFLTFRQSRYWENQEVLYKRGISYSPDSYILHNQLGLEYFNSGDNEKAEVSFKESIRVNPAASGAYINLANVYRVTGREGEAKLLYAKAARIKALSAGRYYEQAHKYKEEARYAKAVILYKKALLEDPRDIVVYEELGTTYVLMGRSREAIPLFIKALEISPDSGVLHNNLAVAYYYCGLYELAVRHSDIALGSGYEVSPKLLEMLEKYR
ncbi:MAG: tetratricopeptide repeat protein [Candidatus Omnitrophota bacterium]|jgi:Flp pilus assembly protein TadD